jgi:hypothetical protein
MMLRPPRCFACGEPFAKEHRLNAFDLVGLHRGDGCRVRDWYGDVAISCMTPARPERS